MPWPRHCRGPRSQGVVPKLRMSIALMYQFAWLISLTALLDFNLLHYYFFSS